MMSSGYGETHGVPKTGNAGMGLGMVGDFGTPQHTTYPYYDVVGIHG
jgi:hypothetical protein